MWQLAIRLDSNQFAPWSNLAEYYQMEAKPESAEVCLRRVFSLAPSEKSNYERLGSLLLALGKTTDAQNVLSTGLNKFPSEASLFYILGCAYTFEGMDSKASGAFQQGIQLLERKPRSTPTDIALRGLFLARLRKTVESRRILDQASASEPTDPDVLILIARAYSVLSEKNKMLKAFSAAHEYNKDLDVAYVRTALDFENFRSDNDLLAIAATP